MPNTKRPSNTNHPIDNAAELLDALKLLRKKLEVHLSFYPNEDLELALRSSDSIIEKAEGIEP